METKITPSICTKIKSCKLERYLGNREIDLLNLQATLHYQVYLNEAIPSSYEQASVVSTIILSSLFCTLFFSEIKSCWVSVDVGYSYPNHVKSSVFYFCYFSVRLHNSF